MHSPAFGHAPTSRRIPAPHEIPRTAGARRTARGDVIAPLVALIVGVTLAGCGGDFAPPSLVETVRILAVRATPPYLPTSAAETTTVEAKIVGVTDGEAPCQAWGLCLLTSTEGGAFTCLDPALQLDLGTAPTATIRFDQIVTLALQGKQYLSSKGLAGGTGGGTGDPTDATSSAPISLIFGAAERSSFPQGCPSDIGAFLDAGCADRARCVIGSKTLRAFTTGLQRHHNPTLTGLEINGIPSEEGVELAVTTRTLKLLPSWSDDSLEPRPDDGGPARESLLFSWFSTAGTYDKQRSYDEVPSNGLTLPAAASAVTVWVVARDGRGGVDWLERRVK